MFNLNLKEARKKAGISQNELAKRCNLSTSYIQQLELGKKKKPSLEVILKLSEALNTPPYMLLDDDEFNFLSNLADKLDGIDNARFGYREQDKLISTKEELKSNKEFTDMHDEYTGIIDKLLRCKLLEYNSNFKYSDLSQENINEITVFLLQMLEMKLSEIQYLKLINK